MPFDHDVLANVEATLDALSSPTPEQAYDALLQYDAPMVASAAARRALAGGGGGGSLPSVTDGVETVASVATFQVPRGAVSSPSAGVAALSFAVTQELTLTDDDIQSLPTAPVELIAAAGANTLIVPIICVAAKDFAAGYTNVGASLGTSLKFTYGSSRNGAHTAGTIQESNYGLFAAAATEQYPVPLGAVEDGNGGNFPPGGADLRNVGLVVQAVNQDGDENPLGDFTGGDPANTLKILVAYTILDLT